MPRQRRLDFPGIIHHVIVRGIEGNVIFRDEHDRNAFLTRFEIKIKETGNLCYAWALMPNHFHLLIRTGKSPLSDLMSRLLTSYAVYFNNRYKRKGYLYQNRYKSILCQEDQYILTLIRYIHLNPLKAGIVSNINELNNYKWTGHSVLVGNDSNNWQVKDEVLELFSQIKKDAIPLYKKFISDGINITEKIDLEGGGLKRSTGGWETMQQSKKEKKYWRGDERILGDSNFVENVIRLAEESITRKEKLKRDGWNIKRVAKKVCELFSVEFDDLQKKRRGEISLAKSLIAYWGHNELGITTVELAKFFNISKSSINENIIKGERLAQSNKYEIFS